MAASKSSKAASGSDKPKAAGKPKATARKSAAQVKPAGDKVTTLKEQPIVEAAKTEPTRNLGNATERGDLFFFYRPGVDDEAPTDLVDVRRLHVVLRPDGGEMIRLITVGRKTLPNSGPSGGNHWAFVDRIFHDPAELKEALSGTTYETETTGERHLPAARPAGEGVYALVRHGRESVLAYALELPEELGEVQQAFGIERQGRFVVSIKNPAIESPAGLGLEPDQQGKLPEELQNLFGARKWHPADPPALLDHPGYRADPDRRSDRGRR